MTAREDQPQLGTCDASKLAQQATHLETNQCENWRPEDQPRPTPPDLLGMKVKLDSTMPVGQIDVEDTEGKRTTILPAGEAQGEAPRCVHCKRTAEEHRLAHQKCGVSHPFVPPPDIKIGPVKNGTFCKHGVLCELCRVETGAHPSQDARQSVIARRHWAKRLVLLVMPSQNMRDWAEVDKLTTLMEKELQLYDARARSTPSLQLELAQLRCELEVTRAARDLAQNELEKLITPSLPAQKLRDEKLAQMPSNTPNPALGKAGEVFPRKSTGSSLGPTITDIANSVVQTNAKTFTPVDARDSEIERLREALRQAQENCKHPVLYEGPDSGGGTICSACKSPNVPQLSGAQPGKPTLVVDPAPAQEGT